MEDGLGRMFHTVAVGHLGCGLKIQILELMKTTKLGT